ncbi:MAG: hypothetical protein COV60_01245 [Candidatus Magasanikbacteria bacterium CG11_big_fil_rev_8_21_14_0_20_43_7]|uniref:Uncharacterized protein n=1 Tax=Candidatus Magasanikbacteria bacterium CG11_big_fil_rev_8_21_14_0_20_43_7 TaxID=1974654 RepID=A0A2H0N301_9BACT|nr:MAG: hypothetical protein COV60_01245 [Candidatus Magasanikbacteria bacterium CG11_big_fil_rev_8_21_14_0_20_43_7]
MIKKIIPIGAVSVLLFLGIFFGLPSVRANVCALETEQAYKYPQSSSIYYITADCTKKFFKNSRIFFTYFDSWGDVKIVSQSILAAIQSDPVDVMPLGPKYDPKYGALVKIITDPKVYLLLGNEKYWITDEAVFNSLKYQWDWIEDIDERLLDKYTTGSLIDYTDRHPNYTLITYKHKPEVYQLQPHPTDPDKQIKKYIEDEAMFVSLGFRWDRIVEIDDGEVYEDADGVTGEDKTDEGGYDKMVCGNGTIDYDEECDGGNYCNDVCEIVSSYQEVPYTDLGSYTDYLVSIGDKVPIDHWMNIRIDSIDGSEEHMYGRRIKYSIWGRDTSNSCRLISTAGEFWTKLDELLYREFTNSFVELVSLEDTDVHLRLYTGQQARQRCEQIAGSKKEIACSFYPTNETYYIQNDTFRIYLTKEHNPMYAHYVIDALEHCHAALSDSIDGISTIRPFDERWKIFPKLTQNEGISADYQRISLPANIQNKPYSLSNLFAEIKNGRCPMEKSYFAHELTHLLFAGTFLQDIYDGHTEAEFNDGRPGSMKLAEGLATFIPYYIIDESEQFAAQNYASNNTSVCGKNSLKNTTGQFDGATSEQLVYSHILNGNGYKQNHYQAGFCFFKRVEDDCGGDTLDFLFNEELKYSGSTTKQPTMFTLLTQTCTEEVVKNIMKDFGFDHELLKVGQQNPRGGFTSSVDTLGCISS